jgi:hypothetical protein
MASAGIRSSGLLALLPPSPSHLSECRLTVDRFAAIDLPVCRG